MNEKATIEGNIQLETCFVSAISFSSIQTEIKEYIDREVTGLCRAAVKDANPKEIWRAEGQLKLLEWMVEQYPDDNELDIDSIDSAESLFIDLGDEIKRAKDYLSVRGFNL